MGVCGLGHRAISVSADNEPDVVRWQRPLSGTVTTSDARQGNDRRYRYCTRRIITKKKLLLSCFLSRFLSFFLTFLFSFSKFCLSSFLSYFIFLVSSIPSFHFFLLFSLFVPCSLSLFPSSILFPSLKFFLSFLPFFLSFMLSCSAHFLLPFVFTH